MFSSSLGIEILNNQTVCLQADTAGCKHWLRTNIGARTENFAGALVDLGMRRYSDLAFIEEDDLMQAGFNAEEISKFMRKVRCCLNKMIAFDKRLLFRFARLFFGYG